MAFVPSIDTGVLNFTAFAAICSLKRQCFKRACFSLLPADRATFRNTLFRNCRLSAFSSTCFHAKACWKVSHVQGLNDLNSPVRSVSGLDARNSPESIQIRKNSGQQTPVSICGPRLGLSNPGASFTTPVHILPIPNSGYTTRVKATPVTSSSYATSSSTPLFEGFSPLKLNRSSQASFINNSFEGFSPPRAHRSTQASGGVPDQHFSSQFPDPPNEPLFPFKSRASNWIEGLVKMGYHRDIAELAIKRDKPSTRRQFESGWKQAEAFFKRHN